MFLQELADLGTVTSAEQLRANATATAARSMRYPVRLSAFAFELLMAFLKGARLFLPLGTINEHVNLQARGMRRLLYHSIRCSIMQDLASKLFVHMLVLGEGVLAAQCWSEYFCSPALQGTYCAPITYLHMYTVFAATCASTPSCQRQL